MIWVLPVLHWLEHSLYREVRKRLKPDRCVIALNFMVDVTESLRLILHNTKSKQSKLIEDLLGKIHFQNYCFVVINCCNKATVP